MHPRTMAKPTPARPLSGFIAGLALAAAACGLSVGSPTPAATNLPTAAPTDVAPATPPPTPVPTFPRNPAPIVDGEPYVHYIDPAMFVDSIDNPFMPWIVGSRFVFDGTEHVEVNVLPDTKEILGVKTTVVHDQVFDGSAVTEDTLDWYAQDRQGNVWYFGEQTAEYENGKVTSTEGSWEGGVDGAQPGIVMLADPQVGDSYRQEFLQGEAEDLAAITATSGTVSSKAGSWSGGDVLVTEEWTPLEPKVREQKTYARGVGVVEAHLLKGGHEQTKLTSVTIGSGTAASGTAASGTPAASSAWFGTMGVVLLAAVGMTSGRRRPGVRSRLSKGSTTPTG
jgi:hypothetical protein